MKPDLTKLSNIIDDAVLTPNNAADFLGCTGQALRQRIKRGQIPAVRIGNRYFIRGRDLKALITPAVLQAIE